MTDTGFTIVGHDITVDLGRWAHGGFAELSRIDLDSLGVSYTRPEAEQTNRRGQVTRPAIPVTLRLNGAIGGVRVFADAGRVRAEAERLAIAADILDHLQRTNPPHRSTLDLDQPQEDTTE